MSALVEAARNGRGRNQNIEALRCLLMFCIVLSHSYVHGIFGVGHEHEDALNAWWGLVFSSFMVWHVDGFVAISGWFGLRFSWRKFVSFCSLMGFYSLVSLVVVAFSDVPLSGNARLTGGWFGSAFLVLMLTAPLINAAIDRLSKGALLRSWFLYAGGMFAGTIAMRMSAADGGFSSYSYLTLALVYVSARVARKLFSQPIKCKALLWGSIVFPLGTLVCVLQRILPSLLAGTKCEVPQLDAMYNYPHVYLFAIILVLLFLWHIKLPEWLKRICNTIAPSMFGVYLLSDVIFRGREIIRIQEFWLFNNTSFSPLFIIVACAVSTFCFCTLFDLVFRRTLVRVIAPIAYPALNRLDLLWETAFNNIKEPFGER